MYYKKVKELKKKSINECDINKIMKLKDEMENYNYIAKSELLNRIKELESKENICQSGIKKHEKDKLVYKKINKNIYEKYTLNLDTLSFYNENNIIVKNMYEIIGEPKYIETIEKSNTVYVLGGSASGVIGLVGTCLIAGFLIPGINIAEGLLITGIVATSGSILGGGLDSVFYYKDKYNKLLRNIGNGTIEDINTLAN